MQYLSCIGMETALHILTASVSATFPTVSGTGQVTSYVFPIVIFAVIIALRVIRSVSGRVYSTARVLRLPVVYTIITLIAVIGIGFLDNVIFLTLALIPVGFLLGYRFGTNVNFFTRNGIVYYRRSPVIMIIWLGSLIGRMILELFYPENLQVMLAIDSALSVTTGLIIGEALNLVSERKKYVPEPAENTNGQEDFRINI